jgi:hypothetical protein
MHSLLFIREMAADKKEDLLLGNKSLINLGAVLEHQILKYYPHGRLVHIVYHDLVQGLPRALSERGDSCRATSASLSDAATKRMKTQEITLSGYRRHRRQSTSFFGR